MMDTKMSLARMKSVERACNKHLGQDYQRKQIAPCGFKSHYRPRIHPKYIRVGVAATSHRLCGSTTTNSIRRTVSTHASADTPTLQDGSNAFDWMLGLALAGCSFEAYNGLNEETKDHHIKQVSPAGTEITYVDEAFVKTKLKGVMEVTLLGAEGLKTGKGLQWWPGASSSINSSVSITVGNGVVSSSVVEGSSKPEWNETFHLFVQSPRDRLTIRVFNQPSGSSSSPELLGTAFVPLNTLMDGTDHDIKQDLKSVYGGSAGSITLSLKFMPFNSDDGLIQDAIASMSGGPIVGTPEDALLASPWRELKEQLIPAEAAADALFDPFAYIDNPESDTQIWCFWNKDLKKACIAFRGTEQTKWKDVLTDLSLVPTALNPESVVESAKVDIFQPAAKALQSLQQSSSSDDVKAMISKAVQAAVSNSDAEGSLWVHSGFLKAYKSVQLDVLRLLDTLLAGETDQWTLYITGHSLGGALSTLCAYDCAKRQNWKSTKPRLINYTYGSPRVGNAVFAQEFDQLVPNAWRVVNKNDAVSLVPRLMGYSHIGHKVSLGPDGEVDIEWNSSQGLLEGADVSAVGVALVNSTLGVEDGASQLSADNITSIIDQEMAAMNCIFDGSAVEEHLEPLYLNNLRGAIEALNKRSSSG